MHLAALPRVYAMHAAFRLRFLYLLQIADSVTHRTVEVKDGQWRIKWTRAKAQRSDKVLGGAGWQPPPQPPPREQSAG